MTQDLPTRLDDLSVDELNQLATVIVGLKEAGYLMREQGFDARFSLVPGLPVLMRLEYRMPHPGPMPALLPESVAQASDDDLQVHLFGSMPAEGPTAAEIDAAVTAACDKVLTSLVARDPVHVPDPSPVPTPAKAESASVAPAKPAPWTELEESQLIGLVAHGIVTGLTKGNAIREAAEALGRPYDGTAFRLNTKLKDRLAAHVEELRAHRPYPAPAQPHHHQPEAAAPEADAAPSPVANPEPIAQAAALTAATLSPIEQHLLDMPSKGGWTLEMDMDLLQLSDNGWTIPEIATELGKDGKAVAERFDLLTGYDRETKTRKWKRADLLAAAREWAGKTKPATAAE